MYLQNYTWKKDVESFKKNETILKREVFAKSITHFTCHRKFKLFTFLGNFSIFIPAAGLALYLTQLHFFSQEHIIKK